MSMYTKKPQYIYIYKFDEENPRYLNKDELLEDFWIWDIHLENKRKDPNYKLELDIWSYHGIEYDEPFYCLYSPKQKFELAVACMHEDTMLENILKKHIPEIDEVNFPLERDCAFDLKNMLKEFNIPLEEFIFDGRYIAILDNGSQWEEIIDSGVINLKKFTSETRNQAIEYD